MEASRKHTADLSRLPPKVAKAIERQPELLNLPLKDLPDDVRIEMLGHIVGTLEGVNKAVQSVPIGTILKALKHEDDKTKLMRHFQDGEEMAARDAGDIDRKVQYPSQDYLVDVEREMAKIMSGPSQHHAMNWELYEKLTKPGYIRPIVEKAIAQLISHDIISHPYEAGTIRYSRVTTDIDKPSSEDEGCVLTFHPPVEERGDILHGLTHKQRIGMKRFAVSFFFDREGEMTMVLGQKTPPGVQKIDAPYNARIHIVPPSTGDEEFGYCYRNVKLVEDPKLVGEEVASIKIREKAKRIESEGRLVGLIKSESGDEYLVFELHDDKGIPFRKAVRKSKWRLSQMVYDVKEYDCVQASVGDVGFGVYVRPKDMGLPHSETIGDMINRISVETCLWSGTSREKTYGERKRAVERTVREIVDAVPGLKMESTEEQMADTRRFISNNRTVITYITGLRDEIETMRTAQPEKFAKLFSDKQSQQILGFNAAQFFQAAAKMIASKDVLNVTYPLENIERFVGEWKNNMSSDERQEVMSTRGITAPILRRMDVMEKTLRAEHSGLIKTIQDEGDKTRETVTATRDALIGRIALISGEQTSLIVDGLRDINEGLKSMGTENRELLKALGIEEEDMHAKILGALDKPRDTELVVETGVNLGVFAVKLRKSMSAKGVVTGVGEPYMLGARMLFEDVKDKFASGFKKLGKAFGRIKEGMKGNLTGDEERRLTELTSLYESTGNPELYG